MSIIVPARNAAIDIAACLSAIRGSAAGLSAELIVVDDASTDETASLAATYADRVISIGRQSRGPAAARNLGAEQARGPILAFVDSDVVLYRDALARMLDAFRDSETSAVFGSYDDNPTASSTVSQYRNLLHHYVHQKSAGIVESFWAGCGAVTKLAFESAGGFDSNRFRRAEMEDVELGYRLVDDGSRIALDPLILCTHRKTITLPAMVRGDFARRGVPWARVLLDRGAFLRPRGLSLGATEKLSAAIATGFALLLAAALVVRSSRTWIAAAIALLSFAAVNAAFFSCLARLRGKRFAAAAIPLHLVYNVTAVTALVWALLSHPFTRSVRARYTQRR